MTSREIEAASRSQIGIDNKQRRISRDIIARMLVFTIEENAKFYRFVESLFPQLGTTTKSLQPEGHDRDCECCQPVLKVATFTPHQASTIDQLFRSNYPAQWAQMHSCANSWLSSLMSGNLPNQGAPLSAAYWQMIQQGATFGHDSAAKDWKLTGNTLPPMPYIVNPGDDFIKTIYTDGYSLASSQITLTALPLAMESINSGLAQGRNWEEITTDLRNQHGATMAHWARLVRTEMAIAAQAGTMASARALNEPSTVMKWSTSMSGKACDICTSRQGHIYEIADFPTLPAHPHCMCCAVITFRKRKPE